MDKCSPASCFKIFPELFSSEGFLSFFPKICSICYISPLTSLVVIMWFTFHKKIILFDLNSIASQHLIYSSPVLSIYLLSSLSLFGVKVGANGEEEMNTRDLMGC